MAGGGESTEDSMAHFLNRLVHETLVLAGPHPIHREWSSRYCQQILPGSGEDRKPDIILIDKGACEDWRNVITLAEMKGISVDPKNPTWFDEVAKRANTLYASQDSRSFVIALQFVGDQFSFVAVDRGGSICLDALGIQEDSEEYLRLVLFFSLADRGEW
jgi:hypothetical protein